MGGTDKSNEAPKQEEGKPKVSPPVPIEDEEFEDGDIATPKRDRNGDDDEPL